MRRTKDIKAPDTLSYSFPVTVTFVLDRTANALTVHDITKLVRDLQISLPEAIGDVIEGEALAVTGSVKRVVVEVGIVSSDKE